MPRPFEEPHLRADLHTQAHAKRASQVKALFSAVVPAVLVVSRLIRQIVFLMQRRSRIGLGGPDIGLVAPAARGVHDRACTDDT